MNRFAYLVLALMLTTFEGAVPQSLQVINENTLFYVNDSKLYFVLELEGGSFFQGVGIIDSTRFFLAYDPGTIAEAGTRLAIYNWQTQEMSLIQEIGGTGESHFSYNQKTGMVAFNSYEGIYVFDIKKYLHASQSPQKAGILYEPTLVVESKQCYYPQWVNENTIGYMKIGSMDDKEILYVKVDSELN